MGDLLSDWRGTEETMTTIRSIDFMYVFDNTYFRYSML